MLSSDVLVSSIQSEIQRVTDDLKGVDENLKRLTGLDFAEPRPRGERRPRVSSSGGWEDEPPPKRKPPGGVFARLGEPVPSAAIPARGRRVHEVPLEEGEIPPRKPLVASSVARPVVDGKSRTEAAAELTKDKVSRERNRRMFGALLGTLQRFRTEEAKQKGKDEKRAKIEKKLEEKGRAEREELQREKRDLISQRKERQERIRRLTIKMERVKEHEAWEDHQRKLGKFIRTKAKPRVFWMPKTLQSRTSQLVKDTREEIERELAEQRIRLKDELDDLIGGSLDLAPAQGEDEEEREMEGEANLMEYNNGSDLLDFDAEEGELEFEDDLMLSGKVQREKGGQREVKGERVVVQFDSSLNRPPQRRVELVTVVANKRGERMSGGVHEGSESEKENVMKGRVVIRGEVDIPLDKGKGRVKEKEEKKKHKEKEKDKEKKEKRKVKEREREKSVAEKKASPSEKISATKLSEKSVAAPKPTPAARESPTKKELKKAQRKIEHEKKKEAEQEDRRHNKEKEITEPEKEDEEKEEKEEEKEEEEEEDDEAATEARLWNDDLSRISLPLEPEPLPEEEPDSADAATAPVTASAPNVTEVVVQHVPMDGLGDEGAEEGGEGEETLQMETMLIDTSAIKADKTDWGEAGQVPIVIIKKEKNPSPPRMGIEAKNRKEGEKEKEKEQEEEEEDDKEEEEEKESDSSDSDSSSDSDDSSDDEESSASSSSEESSSSSSSDSEEEEEKKKREKRQVEEKKRERKKSESSSESDSSSSSEDDRRKKKKSPPRKRPSGARKISPKRPTSRRGEERKKAGRRSRSRSRSRNRKSRDAARRSRSRDRVKKRDRSRSKERRRDRR